jgi:hypothetical protein
MPQPYCGSSVRSCRDDVRSALSNRHRVRIRAGCTRSLRSRSSARMGTLGRGAGSFGRARPRMPSSNWTRPTTTSQGGAVLTKQTHRLAAPSRSSRQGGDEVRQAHDLDPASGVQAHRQVFESPLRHQFELIHHFHYVCADGLLSLAVVFLAGTLMSLFEMTCLGMSVLIGGGRVRGHHRKIILTEREAAAGIKPGTARRRRCRCRECRCRSAR